MATRADGTDCGNGNGNGHGNGNGNGKTNGQCLAAEATAAPGITTAATAAASAGVQAQPSAGNGNGHGNGNGNGKTNGHADMPAAAPVTSEPAQNGAELVLALYEGSIRFLEQAVERFVAQDNVQFIIAARRAKAIVQELRGSLDHNVVPELTTSLEQLYFYIEDQLRLAVLEQSREPIDVTLGLLRTLFAAWDEVIRNRATQIAIPAVQGKSASQAQNL